MKVLNRNDITVFDVDQTLVMYKNYRSAGPNKIAFDYGDETIYLTPHKFHVMFLKHCYKRGDYVIVWSKNSAMWAEQVIKKLKLQKYVHMIMSKPTRHVDDKENINEIVGDRIYLNDEN